MGLQQTKNFLHSKANNQQMKMQPMKQEKIFGSHISDRELILKTLVIHVNQQQKEKYSNLKWDE